MVAATRTIAPAAETIYFCDPGTHLLSGSRGGAPSPQHSGFVVSAWLAALDQLFLLQLLHKSAHSDTLSWRYLVALLRSHRIAAERAIAAACILLLSVRRTNLKQNTQQEPSD